MSAHIMHTSVVLALKEAGEMTLKYSLQPWENKVKGLKKRKKSKISSQTR